MYEASPGSSAPVNGTRPGCPEWDVGQDARDRPTPIDVRPSHVEGGAREHKATVFVARLLRLRTFEKKKKIKESKDNFAL